jgi:methylated-DNA-[protein]-cysteine S-methyltransferase
MYFDIYKSPFGDIAITANDQGITQLAFQQGKQPLNLAGYSQNKAKLSTCIQQLTEYFQGKRKIFELPLAPQGTAFQQSAWQALQQIPYGKTITYGKQAKIMKKETAIRAVGTANGANPIAIIIPCHRVIGANQKLTGYAGGLGLKAKLLMHEGAQFKI